MNIIEEIRKTGILSEDQAGKISAFESSKPLSIHWELRVILYLGVTLLATGLGILVYTNIDSIGHISIIACITAACLACFIYAFKFRLPYSHGTVTYSSPLFDYVILLGCLLLGILIGYVQYQYELFGTHYGLATLLPTIVYLSSAYLFDHKGVLSLGITGLCAWAGISVTPFAALDYSWEGHELYYTGIALGVSFGVLAWVSEWKEIKSHFAFTYNNFSALLFFSSVMVALFDLSMVFNLLLAAGVFWFVRYAREKKSFLFLLYSAIFGYIGFTYFIMEVLFNNSYSDVAVTMMFLYFLASAGGVVMFFVKYKTLLGIKE